MAEGAASTSRGLLGSGSLYAVGTVAPIVIGLLITPLVTRTLGATGYGTVGIGISLYQTGAILLGLGLSAAITRYAIIGTSGVTGAVALVYFGAALSAALAVVAIATLPIWGNLVAGAEESALVWPVISAFGLSTLTLSQSVFRAENRVKTYVGLGIASAVLGPAVGLILISALKQSAALYLTGLAVGHLSVAAVSLLRLRRPSLRSFAWRMLGSNLKIGLPTVPHSVASAMLTTLLVLLVSHFSGVVDAGRTQLALFLGNAPIMVLAAFNNSWAPMIYRASDDQRPALLSRSARAISVLVFVLVGGFCVLVEPVARFIAGPSVYSPELTQVALTVAVATPFMALYLVNINAVFLSGRTGPLAVTTPISATVALVIVILVQASADNSLIIFGAAIPLFHLSMWGMSTLLRARTRYPAPSLRAALPAFFAAALAPLIVLLTSPPFWVSLITFAVVAGGFIFVNRKAIAEFR